MARQARPRVLVTGATRFLGGRFLERFADRYEFIVLARTARPSQSSAYADWVQIDLRDPLPLSRMPSRIDGVVHFASVRTPSAGRGVEELFSVNAGSVASLLEYARQAGARRFVLGSTGGIYGYHKGPIRENTAPSPFDAYTLSKWHGETIARHQERNGGVPVSIVRYFFPYGPGQEAGIIARLAGNITSGSPILLHSGGRHPRLNPVFVDDACELTRRALDARRAVTVNCAGPEVATVRDIAMLLGDLCGVRPKFEAANDKSIGDMVASTGGAKKLLRFAPRVGLRAGLAATIGSR